jgi:DNA-binding NarL/FixJ family response regulator
MIVCDDHRVLTDALEMVVRQDVELELVCPPVHEPGEAIELCREHAPDVVLMDISFEGATTGIAATRRIKAIAAATSVVIMTAHHDERLMLEAAEAGASGYLSKTEGLEAVLAAAKSAARGQILFDATTLSRLLSQASREREEGKAIEARLGRLTLREREVLGLLTEGLRNEDIAERLEISRYTVQTHVSNILGKLEVRSKAEAVAFAMKHEQG